MGERSWPLYFFILDVITLALAFVTISSTIIAAKHKRKDFFLWLFVNLLLIFPLLTGPMATYQDLTQTYCTNLTNDNICTSYMPAPDLKAIHFSWGKK